MIFSELPGLLPSHFYSLHSSGSNIFLHKSYCIISLFKSSSWLIIDFGIKPQNQDMAFKALCNLDSASSLNVYPSLCSHTIHPPVPFFLPFTVGPLHLLLHLSGTVFTLVCMWLNSLTIQLKWHIFWETFPSYSTESHLPATFHYVTLFSS